jgi:Lysylphosphatidylglycerol synthase TM region
MAAVGPAGDAVVDARSPAGSRRHLLRAAGTALALALLYVAFRDLDPRRAARIVLGLGPTAVFLLAPSLLAILCETFAWQRAIAATMAPVAFGPLLRVRVASESLAAVLPLGALWADAARPSLLARHFGLTVGEGVASVAVRKYLLVLSQAGYLLCAFVAGRGILEEGFGRAVGAPGLSRVALLGAAVLFLASELSVLLCRGGSAFQTLLERLSRIPKNPLRETLLALRHGTVRTDRAAARFFGAPRALRLALAAPCLLGWLFEATETWIFLHVLGANVAWHDALAVEAIVVLGRHLLVLLPGGLGVLELGYATFLVGNRASLDICAAFVLLKRLREISWAGLGYLFWTLDRPQGALK